MNSPSSREPAGTRPPLDTPDQIEAALVQVLSLIDTAERLSRARQIVNLSKLDVRVSEICAAIAAQPPSQAPRFAARLTALVNGLDMLEGVTREAYRSLTDARGEPGRDVPESRRVSETTRASAAYTRALSVAPTLPPEPSETGERRRVERRSIDRRRHSDRRATDRRDPADGDLPTPGPDS